ncbi:MAG: hypothetical protein JEZ03_17335, partial [Bacteroidales bacterium]|nr:hypothetical protein [Bacteroidales bacterium]
MKKHVLSLFLLFCSLFVNLPVIFAQNDLNEIDFEIGEKHKQGFMENYMGIINTDPNGYYCLRSEKKDDFGIVSYPRAVLHVDHYDTNLDFIKTTKLKGMKMGLMDNPSKTNFEFIVADSKNDLYVFYSKVDNKSKADQLFKAKLNKDDFLMESPELVLSTGPHPGFKDRRGTYICQTSDDGSKMVIVSLLGRRTKANTYALIHVMTNQFEDIYTKETSIPYSYKNAFGKIKDLVQEATPSRVGNKNTLAISNDATVHLLICVKNKKTRKSNYHILSFNEPNDIYVRNKLHSPELHPLDMIMTFQENGDLCCTGIYSKNKVIKRFDNLSFVTIDKDRLEIKMENLIELTNDQKQAFFSENKGVAKKKRKKLAKGKDVNIDEFNLVDLIKHQNGELTLIG